MKPAGPQNFRAKKFKAVLSVRFVLSRPFNLETAMGMNREPREIHEKKAAKGNFPGPKHFTHQMNDSLFQNQGSSRSSRFQLRIF
jgi:hypothetical protein